MNPALAVAIGMLPTAVVLIVVAGVSPVDAAVFATPLAVPLALRHASAEARRMLRWRVPATVLFASVAVTFVGWNQAALLGTTPSPIEVVCGTFYLSLWLLALHLLRGTGRAALARVVRPRLAHGLASTVTIGVGLPLLFCSLQTHRLRIPQRPPEVAGPWQREEIDFASADGTPLRGTLLTVERGTADHSGAVATAADRVGVVVCHGVGANRAAFFDLALVAARLGCDVLAFDFRAHGESGGHVTTFGLREADDVVAAATELRRRRTPRRLVLVGVSMGAATALCAAHRCAADAVLAESAFTDIGDMIGEQTKALGPLAGVARGLVALAAHIQPGVDVADVAPARAMAALPATVAVALLHAGDDEVIPIAQGRALAAVRPGLDLAVFAGAGHGGCSSVDPPRYRRLLASLLGP